MVSIIKLYIFQCEIFLCNVSFKYNLTSTLILGSQMLNQLWIELDYKIPKVPDENGESSLSILEKIPTANS